MSDMSWEWVSEDGQQPYEYAERDGFRYAIMVSKTERRASGLPMLTLRIMGGGGRGAWGVFDTKREAKQYAEEWPALIAEATA